MDTLTKANLHKLGTAAALLALLGACKGGGADAGAFSDVKFERRPRLPAILTLMPDSPSARETYDGLVSELGEDYDLVPELIDDDLGPADLERLIERHDPKALVLMNNPTLRLYRRFRAIASPSQRRIPAVSVLTSFLRETSGGIDELTGVVYEVPLITSLVNLRALLERPVKRVGVVYRPLFSRFVEEQRRLSAPEGFELVGVEVTGEQPDEVRAALETLRERERVDAIWVLNDNRLLSRETLLEGWLPGLEDNRTPVIVNVRSLVSSQVSFGTFAVLPDHRALGTQTAQLISNLAADGWRVTAQDPFEYPISVEKVLDVDFARRHLDIEERQLATVDQLVE